MKLALIGHPVEHSLSPQIYRKLMGSRLENYDLLSCPTPSDVPALQELAFKYDGINITSPYKTHFIKEVIIRSELVSKLGAINTISVNGNSFFGTNTDVLAVDEILKRYVNEYSNLHLIILGSGVMSKVTQLIALQNSISINILSRNDGHDLQSLDLLPFRKSSHQNLIINTCSRDFIFNGKVDKTDLFWDYNYSFLPHEKSLPSKVKDYHDGQEMLELQAIHAIKFWNENNP